MPVEYRVALSVPLGGNGVNVWHFLLPSGGATSSDLNAAAAALHTFYDDLHTYFPSGVNITFPAEATLIGTAGSVIGFAPVTPPAAVAGTGSGGFAAGAGARVVWGTDAVSNGRRVRGSTFLVPLTGSNYDTNGSLVESYRTTIRTKAQAVITATAGLGTQLAVYSRATHEQHLVTGAEVPDKAAFLRSRRE